MKTKDDKKEIISQLILGLEKELREMQAAAQSAKDLATQDDLKSEGKYDTRAIEASYLAGAQAKRVEEIKLDIQMLEEIELPDVAATKIQLGSLALINYNGHEKFYFISSTSGGALLNVKGESVLVISVFSPIGDAALGLGAGDSFEVETPKETRQYRIIQIF